MTYISERGLFGSKAYGELKLVFQPLAASSLRRFAAYLLFVRTFSAALAILSLSVLAQATPVPERVPLTESIEKELGFQLRAKIISDYIDFKLEFPMRIEPGWVASGTVVWLVLNNDHDHPILATRTDFRETDNGRPVIVTFPVAPQNRDVGVDVVYRCVDDSQTGCEPGTLKHYGILSVRSILERR